MRRVATLALITLLVMTACRKADEAPVPATPQDAPAEPGAPVTPEPAVSKPAAIGEVVTLDGRVEQKKVILTVRNRGPGIEPRELASIFDRFYRGCNATRVCASGSGLGLPIARSIVEAHGGTISITSEPAEVTEVTVILPAMFGPSVAGERPIPAEVPVTP